MSVLDRFLFSATVTCMSTALGRSVLIGYAVVMHVLVLAIVYYNAHHSVAV